MGRGENVEEKSRRPSRTNRDQLELLRLLTIKRYVEPQGDQDTPPSRCIIRPAEPDFLKTPATRPAKITQRISALENMIFTIVPRMSNCSQIASPAFGSTNCGRNARKNIAVLGLRTSTVTLSQKARLGLFAETSIAPVDIGARARNILNPSQIKYAAPPNFKPV